MSRKRIFVVDDDHDILELVATYLEQEGYEVITATGGRHIVSYVQEIQPDLIILDIMLPDMDGIEICVELRKFTHVPIFFLSGKTAEIDKIVGLTIGADDYISKPFSPRELVARVKAHLRRYTRVPKTVLHFPGLEIDLANRHVYANNKMVPLSNKEFSLLAQLAQHPKRVFQVEELFELIWGEQSYGDARTVMVHISNLRKKIEPDPANPVYIITVRGNGYKFNDWTASEPTGSSSGTASNKKKRSVRRLSLEKQATQQPIPYSGQTDP